MADVKVIFSGESRSAVKAAGNVERAIGGVGSRSSHTIPILKSLAKVAAIGVGVAFAGLAATLKVGFDELAEGQKVAAQTGAVLKSTGAIANVTAKEVGDLATSLSEMSSVDDEAIQAGENLLLTFKNVRNEVGKGNDVFNQATLAALDLSVAGFGSLESTSKMMGKALNDPLKGMTALGRAGVTFSEDQKKAIEAMVKSNDLLGAQKIILGEVESQVGGSAKAFGETFPGQIAKLRNAFEEMSGRIAETLLPVFKQLVAWTVEHLPQIEAAITGVVKGIAVAIDAIGDAVRLAIPHLQDFRDFLVDHPTLAKAAAGAILGIAGALAVATVAQFAFNLSVLLNPYVAAVVAIGALVGALVALYLTNERVRKAVDDFYADFRTVAIRTLEIVRGVWERFGVAFLAIAKAALLTVTLAYRNAFDIIRGIFNVFAGLLTGDWSRLWQGLKQIFDGLIGNLLGVIKAQVTAVYELGKAIGKAIIEGIVAGFTSLLGSLKDTLINGVKGAVGSLGGALGIGSPSRVMAEQIGKPMGEGVIRGWIEGSASLPEKMKESIRNAVQAGADAVAASKSIFVTAFSGLTSVALEAFDKIAGETLTKTEKLLKDMDEKQRKIADAKTLSDAKQGVTDAISTGLNLSQGEGESNEDFAKRQTAAGEDIIAAQANLERVLYDQRRDALVLRAEQERVHRDEQTALNRKHLEDRLTDAGNAYNRGAISLTEYHKRVLKIMDDYNIPFKKGAAQLGGALAEGLNEAFADVDKAARNLAQTIVDRLSQISVRVYVELQDPEKPKGKQHGGPVLAGVPYIVGERGPELFLPAVSGRIIPNGALRSSGAGAGMGGGATMLNVHVHADGFFVGPAHEIGTEVMRMITPYLKPGATRFAAYENRV
jgi:hypothetical protein